MYKNFFLCIWLKQHPMIVGVMLLAIAITACDNSTKLQANTSVTSSPTAAPVSPTQNAEDTKPLEQQAVQVIHEYYNAIASRDYKQAYLAWERDGAASKQSFEQFKQGFANIASVAEEVGEPGRLEGAAGSLYIKIPVTVTAVTSNGTPQRFHGIYILRRVNDVPGSTPEQRKWHIYSANISQVR